MSSVKSDYSTFAADFNRDGVVVIRDALNEPEMSRVEQIFALRISEPGPNAARLFPNVYDDTAYSLDRPAFEGLIRHSPIADVAQGLFGGTDVWYYNDQVWQKEGGLARRTPWHQDAAYEPFEGSKTVVLWIPLESHPAENVLEVVRGSHKGPIYNGVRFDPADDTAPLFDDPSLLRFPEIEAERSKWPIFSTAMNRGDILAFHHASIHGGAPIFPGQRRRTLSVRFFGDDVVYRPLGQRLPSKSDKLKIRGKYAASGFENLAVGEPICHSSFYRKVRPWTAKS